MNLRRVLAAAATLGLLAGCTGVPSDSAPQTVEQLPLGARPAEQSIKPTVDAPARQILYEFLQANAADPGKHTSARAFLTAGARNRWSDDTATIITDEVPGTFDARTHTIKVFGRQVGRLDKNGIYTPDLTGDGSGGAPVQYEYKLVQVDGQWRIDQLRPGLLLTDTQFAENYKQHSLYFFDDAEKYLVQDPRYSDATDRAQLAEWLLTLLEIGPREELQDAVTSDTLPAQADGSRITVELGAPSKVEIPGSSQLDSPGRDRLAAQVAQTLDEPLSSGDIVITDGGRPVTVPAVHGDRFGPANFSSALGRTPPSPAVYYLDNGRVYSEDGKAVPGALERQSYYLTSLAVSRPTPTGPLLVAGIQGTGAQSQLWVGSQATGLKPTSVRGGLTRPTFDPGRGEVWVAGGNRLNRVAIAVLGGKVTAKVEPPVALDVPQGARVLAARLSPDGARIAVVLGEADSDGGELMIGSVVRGAGDVRIDALEPISPQKALITDVAWLNPLRLFAIGRVTSSQDPLTFDTGVDGTDWTSRVVGLSSRPDHVTVTAGASAWVSAGGFVWVQSGGQWASPTGGQTPGTSPVYVE